MSEIPDESIPVIDPVRSQDSQKPSMAGDVAKIATGTVLAQFAGLIISPILLRIFTTEDYGVYQVFNSIFFLLLVLASLRYENAIVLPEDERDGANLFVLSCFLSFLVALCTLILFHFFGIWLSEVLNAPELAKHVWLISVNVFLMGIFNSANYWNTRTRKFGRLSFAKLNNSISSSLAQLGVGIAGWIGPSGLIAGTIIGSFASSTVLIFQTWIDDGRMFLSSVNRKSIIDVAIRYKKFPIYSTWASLLSALSQQLPTLLLSGLFNNEITGLYALGNRILRLPAQLIGAAISQVLYKHAAEAARDGSLTHLVQNTLSHLVTLGLFPFILIMLVGKEAFTVVYGPSWSEAGVYSQILALWTFFSFIGAPLTTINLVLERQEVNLFFNVILFVTRLLSLLIGAKFHDARLAMIIFSISGSVIWIWYTMWILKTCNISLIGTIFQIFKYVLICSPFISVILITRYIFHSSDLMTVLISVILAITFYTVVFFRDPEIRQIFFRYIKARD